MHQAVISGAGFITSIGNDRREVVESLREGRCGIAPWQAVEGIETPVKIAGTIKDFDVSAVDPVAWKWPHNYDFDPAFIRTLAPHGLYAACAIEQALPGAMLTGEDLRDGGTGLCCASAGSPRLLHHHLNAMARTGWQRSHPLALIRSAAGTLNYTLGAHYAIRGSNCGFVSACTSSSHALGFAFDDIALGRQRRMIVVGAEDLTAENLLPFHAMGALSLNRDPNTASRPFDRERDGFVGTGGAVALIVEEEQECLRRGVRPMARLLGWGQASDGFHVAAPHPEGAGLLLAMKRACEAAKVRPQEIDYINAHAPSTPAGDRAESLAVKALFGSKSPAISSTKALTGHGLSLAGAMEAAFCVLAIAEGFVPGQFHLREPLPEGTGLDFPSASREPGPRLVLNNASGFGGTNVCHVFARYD
ncbi:MAG: beta-ketoacyl-[acyl-carrier-protein] synthase family protein [Verrucomicrobiales bacterium]